MNLGPGVLLGAACVGLGCSGMGPLGDEAFNQGALSSVAVGPMCAGAMAAERQFIGSESAGHCVRWFERRLTYQFDAKGTQTLGLANAFDAVRQAFATWQAATNGCSDLRFVEGPRLTSPDVGADGHNVVLFRDRSCDEVVPSSDPCWHDLSCGNAHHCWQHDSSTIALTTSSYVTSTGELVEGDIEINSALKLTVGGGPRCDSPSGGVANCTWFDLQAAVTHEIGHWLGLAHSAAPGSTMSPISSAGDLSMRVLDSGTACFVCAAYPSGEPSRDCI